MPPELYIGLMSGTSVDGVDGVLVDFSGTRPRSLAAIHAPFPAELRSEIQKLQTSAGDEIHRAALAANALMDVYSDAVAQLLARASLTPSAVRAIGSHGQTIRHRPELGYTTQLANPARLAERTGISVVADFRSRDVAAGGQGAPLAPAFHDAMFRGETHRVVLNLGGIANLTDLSPVKDATGFDVGPANTLLDAWCELQTGAAFDRDGVWAAGGRVIPPLLDALLDEPYFLQPPPKSTGRDLFNPSWLEPRLRASSSARDVQRTLVALTVTTVRDAVTRWCTGAREVLACGGGARNAFLMAELGAALGAEPTACAVTTTASYGVPVDEVEALAFAWLARETLQGRAGNLPSVTGAAGPRILGAIHPA